MGDGEGAESSLQGSLVASKESWRDEETAERQRGAFKERWVLMGRLRRVAYKGE